MTGSGQAPVPPEEPGPGAPASGQARIRPYLRSAAASEPEPSPGPEPGSVAIPRPRPFILTAGRVQGSDPDVGLETQVTAVGVLPPDTPPVEQLGPELRRIVELCAEPLSVAEISALIPLHLGVTKVLVGDLRADGYLRVHALDDSNAHDPDTILRVIRGLRALS